MKNTKKENQLCSSTNILSVKVDMISPNPYQPRNFFDESKLNELKDSIIKHGLLQPITVLEQSNNLYILIAGERRLRASILAGFPTIKAIVLKDIDDKELQELAIVENIQRDNLNVFELATAYKSLKDTHNYSHDDIATLLATNITKVTKHLSINKLNPEQIQFCMVNNYSALENLYLLSKMTKEPNFEELFEKIVLTNMSVKEIQQLIKSSTDKTSNQDDIEEKIEEEKKTNKFPKIQNQQITIDKKDSENLRMFIKINELTTDEYREFLHIVYQFFKLENLTIFLDENQKAFKKGGVK